jgi:hypothetical protein
MERVRGNLGLTAAICLGVALLIQVIRPPRENPPTDPTATIAAHVAIPPATDAILHRACYDCHSNDTRWPWYSGVAPISWFVIGHVNDGREALNFENWSAHRSRNPVPPLNRVCSEVKSGGMPLSTYLWMHADAQLSADDKTVLCDWIDALQRSGAVPASGGR